jgi:hypothetical protein
MDTSTIRLVIFLGMFLFFAGDYSFLSSIFGNTGSSDVTAPKAQLKELRDDIPIVSKNNIQNDGKNGDTAWKPGMRGHLLPANAPRNYIKRK